MTALDWGLLLLMGSVSVFFAVVSVIEYRAQHMQKTL